MAKLMFLILDDDLSEKKAAAGGSGIQASSPRPET
jgi:hypothetical protein